MNNIHTAGTPCHGAKMSRFRILVTLALIIAGGCGGTEEQTTSDATQVDGTSSADTSQPDSSSSPGNNDATLSPDTQKDDANNGKTYPLYLTTMTHMERGFTDNKTRQAFDNHVAQLRNGISLFTAYGAKMTVESERPFAEACDIYGVNMMKEVLDAGHGVGTHCDRGYDKKEATTYDAFVADLKQNKSLVDKLVGAQNNRHCSGAGSHLDWARALAEAGFEFVDGVVGMHYLAMPLENRPDGWTDDAIYGGLFHEEAPVEFKKRFTLFRIDDTNDFEEDLDGRMLISSGGIGRVDQVAEGDCGDNKCTFDQADIDAIVEKINRANAERDPTRISKLTLYIPANMFDKANDTIWKSFLGKMQELQAQGKIKWATQGEVYDAFLQWELQQ